MDDAKGIIPIIVTVALTLYGFQVGFCLTVGIILTFVLGRVKPTEAASMIWKGLKWNTALAAFSTLYLRDMILHSGSVNSLFTVIIEAGVSRIAIAVLVPLLIGSISGSPTMGIGISFPLLLPLFSDPNIHIVSIIFVGIICTYITSPIHLCLVLSNSYYKSDLNKVIRYLAPSGAALYILGVAYHLFLNAIK